MATRTRPMHREVIGNSTTNPRSGSQHAQTLEPRWLWSYAQAAALTCIAEKAADGIYYVINDPERRAKRIAAAYADLYFKSAEKSKGKLQLYWPGLAAFVVKDIVEAYRYSRDEVLSGGWRNWDAAKIGSQVFTGSMPYDYALQVYAALAKGNLWLFMDIYPWLWFVLEYGLNNDGSLNEERLNSHVGERNADTFQPQAKDTLQHLPFSASWSQTVMSMMSTDALWAEASKIASPPPSALSGMGPGMDMGINPTTVPHGMAHRYLRQNMKRYAGDYHLPQSEYWGKFSEALYVMESERTELTRVTSDTAAIATQQRIARFTVTPEIRAAYGVLIKEFKAGTKKVMFEQQQAELVEIAKQEQLQVLQPLIYQDRVLINVMDLNHKMSRFWGSWLSPKYAVVYSAQPKTDDPKLQTVFDPSTGVIDRAWTGATKSLPKPVDRMEYVNQIAEDYNGLMQNNRAYMEAELQKIRAWRNA
jgi:hypothetical protein